MATTVTLTSATARPSGAQNLVGEPTLRNQIPVGANQQVLVGDLVLDAGVFANGTGTSTPPASATGLACTCSNVTVSGSTFTQNATYTTVAGLQLAIHNSLLGVSETYRPYSVTTTGTIRDYISTAITGEAKFSLIPTVLDGTSYTGQGTAAIQGQLVAVAVTAINGSNYFVSLDANGLPYVEIVPIASQASGAGLKVAIGQVAKPVSTTDTSVTVRFNGSQLYSGGGMFQPIVA